MQRHHIHVTFRQHGGLSRRNGAPGLLQAVQVFAFFVQLRITAVDVFGFVLVGDDAPAKRDDVPRKAADGEHQPPAETVIGPAPLALAEQCGLHPHRLAEPGPPQHFRERLPIPAAPAKPEELRHLFRNPSPGHIVPALRTVPA